MILLTFLTQIVTLNANSQQILKLKFSTGIIQI
jgi:hypothetical protein